MGSGFINQLAIGKQGEDAVVDYFHSRNHKVTDVSDVKEYQRKDIDLLLENQQGQKCSVEIKTDNRMNKTGNLFFELGHNRLTGYKDGWVKYCEADYICFLDNVAKKGYMVNWKKLKPHLSKLASYRSFYDYSDDCYSDAYLLSLVKAQNAGFVSHSFAI